jgi:hypothetical protein
MVEFPPVTLFTDQVTLVFELPLTVAENCVVEAGATLMVVWFSVIVTSGAVGGVGEVGEVGLVEELFEPQPANTATTATARPRPRNLHEYWNLDDEAFIKIGFLEGFLEGKSTLWMPIMRQRLLGPPEADVAQGLRKARRVPLKSNKAFYFKEDAERKKRARMPALR